MTSATQSLLTGPARAEAIKQLREIADEIDALYRQERDLHHAVQALREKQASLNRAVYSA